MQAESAARGTTSTGDVGRGHAADGSAEWWLAACRVARAAQTKEQVKLSDAINYGACYDGGPHSELYSQAVDTVMLEAPLPFRPPHIDICFRGSKMPWWKLELQALPVAELGELQTMVTDAIAKLRAVLPDRIAAEQVRVAAQSSLHGSNWLACDIVHPGHRLECLHLAEWRMQQVLCDSVAYKECDSIAR